MGTDMAETSELDFFDLQVTNVVRLSFSLPSRKDTTFVDSKIQGDEMEKSSFETDVGINLGPRSTTFDSI